MLVLPGPSLNLPSGPLDFWHVRWLEPHGAPGLLWSLQRCPCQWLLPCGICSGSQGPILAGSVSGPSWLFGSILPLAGTVIPTASLLHAPASPWPFLRAGSITGLCFPGRGDTSESLQTSQSGKEEQLRKVSSAPFCP